MATFENHKFCAECGRVMKVERKEFFNRFTGEAQTVMIRKVCPNFNKDRIGDPHDATIWSYGE